MADPNNFFVSDATLAVASTCPCNPAAGDPAAGAPAAIHKTVADDVSIHCYDDEVPPFVEAELERLYRHIFSSLIHFRAYGGLPGNSGTYVVRRNNSIVTIFLFLREGSRVSVINEGMKLDDEDLKRFADYVFATYRSVNVISFHAVRTEIRKLPFPYQRYTCTEDIVAIVPESREAYLASLGKSTRSYLHRYENKLRRSFPSFCLKVYEKDEVRDEDIRAIAKMNRERMAAKAKVSSNDDEETERIIALAKESGFVCVATIDGRVCAGVIHYRLGPNFFMPVIAHDAQYNDYRLGTICCFLSICECIARGCREYHFLWGKYEYKYRLGGIQRDLDHLAVYRSPLHFLLNADMALKLAIDGRLRLAKQWLQDQAKQQGQGGLMSRVVFKLANDLRNLKRRGIRSLLGRG
jgi:hypothetical protein